MLTIFSLHVNQQCWKSWLHLHEKHVVTFDCRNLVNRGKVIRSYWIGFEFSKIKEFDDKISDIVLYSYAFGQIIDKHFWLINDLILTSNIR